MDTRNNTGVYRLAKIWLSVYIMRKKTLGSLLDSLLDLSKEQGNLPNLPGTVMRLPQTTDLWGENRPRSASAHRFCLHSKFPDMPESNSTSIQGTAAHPPGTARQGTGTRKMWPRRLEAAVCGAAEAK